MDADGPGTVVSFWLTTFKREGKLRIYFDNNTQPEIIIPAYDLMQGGLQLGKALLTPHSSYEPKEKGGSNLYLPMPFSKHRKITWEDAEEPMKQPHYYQINYRKYDAGTKVKTFTLAQLKQAKPLADEVNNELLHPVNTVVGQKASKSQAIEPGKEMTLQLASGSSAVHFLNIKLRTDGDYAQALRSTILKISFDGQQTVWCPLGDFAGSGVGGKPVQSCYRSVNNDGEIVTRFIMPYKNKAVISVLNLTDKAATIDLAATTKKWTWYENSMYFHTNWKSESNVSIKGSETDTALLEWNFNTISGKGKFIGDTFSVLTTCIPGMARAIRILGR